jgi:hypothetical protein
VWGRRPTPARRYPELDSGVNNPPHVPLPPKFQLFSTLRHSPCSPFNNRQERNPQIDWLLVHLCFNNSSPRPSASIQLCLQLTSKRPPIAFYKVIQLPVSPCTTPSWHIAARLTTCPTKRCCSKARVGPTASPVSTRKNAARFKPTEEPFLLDARRKHSPHPSPEPRISSTRRSSFTVPCCLDSILQQHRSSRYRTLGFWYPQASSFTAQHIYLCIVSAPATSKL